MEYSYTSMKGVRRPRINIVLYSFDLEKQVEAVSTVDTGADYSIIPENFLRTLGYAVDKPIDTFDVRLGVGDIVALGVYKVFISIKGVDEAPVLRSCLKGSNDGNTLIGLEMLNNYDMMFSVNSFSIEGR